ncbi:MAG: hypothetical protein OXF79_20945 [Chloroflexi bacterium]|nr:hypothetical protein [Chloroflexota bacterium]
METIHDVVTGVMAGGVLVGIGAGWRRVRRMSTYHQVATMGLALTIAVPPLMALALQAL